MPAARRHIPRNNILTHEFLNAAFYTVLSQSSTIPVQLNSILHQNVDQLDAELYFKCRDRVRPALHMALDLAFGPEAEKIGVAYCRLMAYPAA
jgi:NADH:ubiquinone oxidoreductase subunit